MKKAICLATAVAIGTAAIMAYSSMKPAVKNKLKKEYKETVDHIDGVKEDICNVCEDVSDMAATLKNQM